MQILVSEMTNTVSVHFEGFSDYEDAKDSPDISVKNSI